MHVTMGVVPTTAGITALGTTGGRDERMERTGLEAGGGSAEGGGGGAAVEAGDPAYEEPAVLATPEPGSRVLGRPPLDEDLYVLEQTAPGGGVVYGPPYEPFPASTSAEA